MRFNFCATGGNDFRRQRGGHWLRDCWIPSLFSYCPFIFSLVVSSRSENSLDAVLLSLQGR